MKKRASMVAVAAVAFALSIGFAVAEENPALIQIESVLSNYEKALNSSDTDTVVKLYAHDGVFMAQHSEPNIGKDAVRAAYDRVFQAITLDIAFTVDEIRTVSPQWAFARTRSKGFVTVNQTGAKGPEANQEVFLFNRQGDGDWKIARYIFSTTNPPRR
jgi:uncharacterized protein (TIGR02246 family)